MKVGVCGVGRMGEALAERLMEVGHEVHIWNRTAGRCDPLVAQGAKREPSPAALVEACEATIVIVIDEAAQVGRSAAAAHANLRELTGHGATHNLAI